MLLNVVEMRVHSISLPILAVGVEHEFGLAGLLWDWDSRLFMPGPLSMQLRASWPG